MLERNSSPFTQYLASKPRAIYMAFFAIIACAICYKFISIFNMLTYPGLNGFGCTEFLINWQDGFVRRGALGELLYNIVAVTGIPPHYLISSISLLAFIFIGSYFVIRFKKLHLDLWLLLTPFLIGFVAYIIRKDFLIYGILIVMFILLKRENISKLKIGIVLILGIIGLFLHEAFIFWGIPIVVLTLVSHKNTRVPGIVCACIFALTFLLMSYFKGSSENATAIVDSWNNLLGYNALEYETGNSIGALGWDTKSTFLMHLYSNFNYSFYGWIGLLIKPIYAILIYYFLSNLFFVFKGGQQDRWDSEKTSFSALLLLSFICLLPMFTVLSCDYGRLYQYIGISVVGAYITFSRKQFMSLFSNQILNGVAIFNHKLSNILKPTPALIIFLFLVLGEAPFGLNPVSGFTQSPLGSAFSFLETIVERFVNLII